jgi:hypothetical protein
VTACGSSGNVVAEAPWIGTRITTRTILNGGFQTLKDHREKLDALPEERRKSVEEGLRRSFETHTKDFWALDGHPDYFEKLESLYEIQERQTAEHVDRAHEAWLKQGREQDQSPSSPDDKLRKALKEKVQQREGQEKDRDQGRER